MLKIYGSSLVQNYKTILVKLDRGKAIKKDYKAFKGIINLIDKKTGGSPMKNVIKTIIISSYYFSLLYQPCQCS